MNAPPHSGFRERRRRPDRRLRASDLPYLALALTTPAAAISADAIRFMLLTGAGQHEVLAARWDAVDLANRRWGERPLCPPAIHLLSELKARRSEESCFVFPGREPGSHLKDLSSAWTRYSRRATVAMWAARPDTPAGALVARLASVREREPRFGECRAAARSGGIDLPAGLTDVRLDDLPQARILLLTCLGFALPVIGELVGATPSERERRRDLFPASIWTPSGKEAQAAASA